MVTETTSDTQGNDEEQQLQRSSQNQYSSQPIDVRMKRHPELQPYVPSDRDKVNKRPTTNKPNINKPKNVNVSPSSRQKKCVSMTRLDQLAQPKRIFTKTGTATSSTTTKITTKTVKSASKEGTRAVFGCRPDPTVASLVSSPSLTPSTTISSSEGANDGIIDVVAISSNTASNGPSTVSSSVSTETSTNPSTTASMTTSLSNGKLKEDEEIRLKEDEEIRLKEDEEIRLKAEEEIKEVARRGEEERRSRQHMIDSILSKFNINQIE